MRTFLRFWISAAALAPVGSSAQTAPEFSLHAQAKYLLLSGLTVTAKARGWSNPQDYAPRWFVGDRLGRIRVRYTGGLEDVYPLILGESVWFGKRFADYPEPYRSNSTWRGALDGALRLFPQGPQTTGVYHAYVILRPLTVSEVRVSYTDPIRGIPEVTGATPSAMVPEGPLPLRREGEDEAGARARLARLRQAVYTTSDLFSGSVPPSSPPGYAGPRVAFAGSEEASILANAFHYNLNDLAAKVTADGAYHTSTLGALSWGGYNGFGTFTPHRGNYYREAWGRDLGRSLHELTVLGYLDEARRCADYCLAQARRNTPPHWTRVINEPEHGGNYENDAHGLITVYLYELWRRLPDRDEWLRARWKDLAAAGDWILWQFDHPEVSGATDVLHTTSECSVMDGTSVYADDLCREALLALARMGDSIGERDAAGRWRERAARMREAIARRYLVTDPRYGRTWTLDHAGWPNQSTVLGPLIFTADFSGLAPEDDDPARRPANFASYRRLVDSYRPKGYYGAAMGYGQGFVTQAALLLDQMADATQMLKWAAQEIYDPRNGSFIVPEGCEIDPSGKYWYRMGDLGNGVQEAEVVKALRVLLGVDDAQDGRLRLFPRLPYGWTEMTVENYPILVSRPGGREIARLRYRLLRAADGGLACEVEASRELAVDVRLGPFAEKPGASSARINGRPLSAQPEHSGDSWWVRATIQVPKNR